MNLKYRKELIQTLIFIGSKKPELMDAFIEDILTPAELEEIVTRWQIIRELAKGIPQREIAEKLGVSIAKITRGSRELKDTKGGFQKVLNQI